MMHARIDDVREHDTQGVMRVSCSAPSSEVVFYMPKPQWKAEWGAGTQLAIDVRVAEEDGGGAQATAGYVLHGTVVYADAQRGLLVSHGGLVLQAATSPTDARFVRGCAVTTRIIAREKRRWTRRFAARAAPRVVDPAPRRWRFAS